MRKKINVGMIYSSIITAVGFALMVIGIILLYFFPPEKMIVKIAMTIAMGLPGICCLIGFLALWQTAIFDEWGVTFKCSFIKVAYVKWVDIKKIEISNLPTLESRGRDFNFNWIIIYTDFSQKPKVGVGNYKNKPPWQINATKKNIAIIKSFIALYCPNIQYKLD